jgi:hypothetical protein
MNLPADPDHEGDLILISASDGPPGKWNPIGALFQCVKRTCGVSEKRTVDVQRARHQARRVAGLDERLDDGTRQPVFQQQRHLPSVGARAQRDR